MNILLVDDNDLLRKTLCHHLTREGHSVSSAANGDEALKLAETNPPDVVVTDIVMPQKDGLETITEIRARFPSAKVIAISGHPLTESYDEDRMLQIALAMGADHTLIKPFSAYELIGCIRRLRGDR